LAYTIQSTKRFTLMHNNTATVPVFYVTLGCNILLIPLFNCQIDLALVQ